MISRVDSAAPKDTVGFERRQFLRGSLAVAGCLLLDIRAPAAGADIAHAVFAPDAFIRIEASGKITLIMPQTEMGQGIYTAVATILAEELDADLAQVTLEAAPPDDKLYANPLLGFQATGGSTSVRAFWMPLRKTAARARYMLVQAAAAHLKVDAASLITSQGAVIHAASSRHVSYAELVTQASSVRPPDDPPLKDPKQFVLIGRPLKRLDTPEKVNGRTRFGIDAMPDGLQFATLRCSPVFGGKVAHVEDAAALQVPGVRQVLRFDDMVAVVGDHTWAAKQGLDALNITWSDGAGARTTSADIWQKLHQAGSKEGAVAKTAGDAAGALHDGELHEATYALPLLAHAALEPMNCTAHVTPTGCEVWVGTQVISRAQAVAMKVTGLPAEKVIIHNQLIGGGFGRRLDIDGIEKGVRVATRVAAPVKVIWTREEDIRQDFYRPAYLSLLSATLANGRIHGWKHRIVGSSVLARWAPPAFKDGLDSDAVDAAADQPYELPNLHVDYVQDEPYSVPTGFWRGVGPNNNVFVIESFMDELAAAAKADPIAFRLAHLEKAPRFQAVLKLAAEKAGWGTSLPSGTGRGVSLSGAFGSYAAAIVQAAVAPSGEIRIQRLVIAVDVGTVINPDTVVAQLQGGAIFAMTAALYGRIDIENGRVKQSNFHDYRMMRMNEVPQIEIHLVPSGEAPGGIGEAGTSVTPPALVNALYAATGIRLRQLPIDRSALSESKRS